MKGRICYVLGIVCQKEVSSAAGTDSVPKVPGAEYGAPAANCGSYAAAFGYGKGSRAAADESRRSERRVDSAVAVYDGVSAAADGVYPEPCADGGHIPGQSGYENSGSR